MRIGCFAPKLIIDDLGIEGYETVTPHSWHLFSLSAVLAVAPRAVAQQPEPVRLDGCYQLNVGPWSRSLGVNAAYHAIPPMIRLDTTAVRGGRVVRPNIAFPRGTPAPGTPRWILRNDTVEVLWSSGYQSTAVYLAVVAADSLRGHAVVGSDANEFGPNVPRAAVVASRVACPAWW